MCEAQGVDGFDCPTRCPTARPTAARAVKGDVKELRVKIDVSYHLKLHALKLLRNKKMSDAIEEALDHYFEHVVNERQALEGTEPANRLF